MRLAIPYCSSTVRGALAAWLTESSSGTDLQKRKRAGEDKAAKGERAWTKGDVKALEDKLLLYGAGNAARLREAVRAAHPWSLCCRAYACKPRTLLCTLVYTSCPCNGHFMQTCSMRARPGCRMACRSCSGPGLGWECAVCSTLDICMQCTLSEVFFARMLFLGM